MPMHRTGFSIFWHTLSSFSGGRFDWNQNFRLKSGTLEGDLYGFKVPPESVLLYAGLMFHYMHNDLRLDTLRAGDRRRTGLKGLTGDLWHSGQCSESSIPHVIRAFHNEVINHPVGTENHSHKSRCDDEACRSATEVATFRI